MHCQYISRSSTIAADSVNKGGLRERERGMSTQVSVSRGQHSSVAAGHVQRTQLEVKEFGNTIDISKGSFHRTNFIIRNTLGKNLRQYWYVRSLINIFLIYFLLVYFHFFMLELPVLLLLLIYYGSSYSHNICTLHSQSYPLSSSSLCCLLSTLLIGSILFWKFK